MLWGFFMLEFEVDLSAIEVVGKVAQRMSNFGPALRKSGIYLERQTRNRFLKEEDPDGRPWTPLSKATLKQKKTRAILRETGSLAASISMSGPANNEVKVSSSTFYGIYHQTGTKAFQVAGRRATLRFKVGKSGRSKFAKQGKANFEQDVNIGGYQHPGIPARPFLGINEQDVAAIRGIFQDHVEGK